MNKNILALAACFAISTAHATAPEPHQDAPKAAPADGQAEKSHAESHGEGHSRAPKVDPFQFILVDCTAFSKGAVSWSVVKPTSVYAKSPDVPLDRVGLAPGFPLDMVTTNSIPLPAVLAKKCGN